MDTKEHAELVKHNQEHFDEQAKKWDDDEEYVSVSKESYATLMKHIGQHINHEHTRVLNFGCGTGLMEAQLRGDAKQIVGVDVSSGMVERMQYKIDHDQWDNVKVVQADILEDSGATQQLQSGRFDLIISCYTFHHLNDVSAIGKALIKCLGPSGYFCMIEFAAKEDDYKEFRSNLSDSANASIGAHDGFAKDFLLDFYQNQLGLINVQRYTLRVQLRVRYNVERMSILP